MALTKVQTIGIETGITFTGITTTSSLQATTINVSGIATFGGNVSIAGTLTYEDVTDVDSVGLITARSGVNITGGGLVVTGVTTVSAGSTSIPSISPSGDTNTGIFFPSPDTIAFGEGGSEVARFDSSGRLGIGTNNPGSFDNFANQLVVGSGSGNNGITIYAGSTSLSSLSFGDGTGSSSYQGYLAYSHSTDSLGFYVNYSGSSSARMVIDSSGRLLVGTSSNRVGSNVQLQLEGTGYSSSSGSLTRNSNDSGGPSLILGKSRGTSNGSYTVAQSADSLGTIQFVGADGSTDIPAAYIFAQVDGTPGTNDMPGRLVFSTTADGASSPTERMRLDSSGRLGIGTTSPSEMLHVTDNIRLGSGVGSGASLLFSRSGQTDAARVVCDSSSNLAFWTNTSERARIDSSGRLLIGTSTSALEKLVIKADGGGIQINRNDSGNPTSGQALGSIGFKGIVSANSNAAAEVLIQAAAEENHSGSTAGSRLEFHIKPNGTGPGSSPTERMRINQSGTIGSFATSLDANIYLSNAATAGVATPFLRGRYGATGMYGGTDSVYIWSNGNIQNTNNSYTAISDIKLKENIVDANSQWADIKALRVRNYSFKEGQIHKQIGLIAQEVEPISPNLVYETPDRDADGNDLGTTTKAVQYSVLYMKAVKALQEAMERIEQLESEMAAVKAQLS